MVVQLLYRGRHAGRVFTNIGDAFAAPRPSGRYPPAVRFRRPGRAATHTRFCVGRVVDSGRVDLQDEIVSVEELEPLNSCTVYVAVTTCPLTLVDMVAPVAECGLDREGVS